MSSNSSRFVSSSGIVLDLKGAKLIEPPIVKRVPDLFASRSTPVFGSQVNPDGSIGGVYNFVSGGEYSLSSFTVSRNTFNAYLDRLKELGAEVPEKKANEIWDRLKSAGMAEDSES